MQVRKEGMVKKHEIYISVFFYLVLFTYGNADFIIPESGADRKFDLNREHEDRVL